MTTPVLVHVTAGLGPTCGSEFAVSFYLAPEVADPPPRPTSSLVGVVTMPPMRVFARAYGGFATEQTVVREAAALATALKSGGATVADDAPFWAASYDSPFRLIGRRNEVWIAAPPAAPKN
jgi:hypothetical protein